MTDTLSALDALFLELEQLDEGALMSIGATMVFDPRGEPEPAPTIDELRATLAGRLGALPRYAQRLSDTRVGGLSWPHWERDPEFDIRNHVRHAALPAPGGDRQLCEWTAEFFSRPLDRTRPLWEIVLLNGLEHGRWALCHKVHHCLVDGVGSVDLVGLLLDEQPDGPRTRTADALPATPEGGARRSPRWRAPEAVAQGASAGAHAAEAALHAAVHPREALGRARAVADLIVRDELIGAPRTSLNVPIGQARRFAIVRGRFEELRAIGHELDASFNDVMLAGCAGGLRALLSERGEPLPPGGLRAMVPVNLRTGSDARARGNRVSSLFVELPVAEPDAAERVRQIAVRTGELKAAGAARGPTAMIDLAGMAPPIVNEAALAQTALYRRLFNVTITNVAGSPAPAYAFGSELRDVLPIVPLAAEHAVGISILSYNGMVSVGINADRDSVPDLDVLADGIEESLKELVGLAGQRSAGASPP